MSSKPCEKHCLFTISVLDLHILCESGKSHTSINRKMYYVPHPHLDPATHLQDIPDQSLSVWNLHKSNFLKTPAPVWFFVAGGCFTRSSWGESWGVHLILRSFLEYFTWSFWTKISGYWCIVKTNFLSSSPDVGLFNEVLVSRTGAWFLVPSWHVDRKLPLPRTPFTLCHVTRVPTEFSMESTHQHKFVFYSVV